ncbi:DUF616 domain-containing protein [Echinicola jeungdonensis]|uniref:Glycosyltransferase domain-containing protein n=1 Tax=Echinicola jeungdonensis TaxID=709343 RepID=A0ABV5J6U9_9BACT|nr:glycosyltransferase domain-containing protein [Echinicola jeungdonensis]MDN3670800.1 DUF616 domain-containing protein [Echinicola jeungdonensis]
MNNKLIYSIVTNNYDTVKPAIKHPDFDFWLFTDNEDLKVPGWETKPLPKAENPIRQQRGIKINSCLHTADYKVTIYMDANIEIIKDPAEFLAKHYKGGFLTTKHPKRFSVQEESEEILRKNKDLPSSISKTLGYAEEIGFKDEQGLFETMIIVRDKSTEVAKLEKQWSHILENYSHRDQLSLPIASFLTGVKIDVIPRTETFKYMKRTRGHNISWKFRKNGHQKKFQISNIWHQLKLKLGV